MTHPSIKKPDEKTVKSFYVNNLFISYNNNPIINDLSFSAKPGEILAIMGPNGAGKSSLLHTLAGLHRPYKGTIGWDNKQPCLPEEVAYAKLRKTAMDKNLKLVEVAQRMLDVMDLLS